MDAVGGSDVTVSVVVVMMVMALLLIKQRCCCWCWWCDGEEGHEGGWCWWYADADGVLSVCDSNDGGPVNVMIDVILSNGDGVIDSGVIVTIGIDNVDGVANGGDGGSNDFVIYDGVT